MKTRFSTIDIRSVLAELQSFIGLRVNNIYDVDHKTYLIKLAKPDAKAVILLESGIRIHSTEFDWPKSHMPSGFAMKLRKHLRNRRLESIEQIGIDRIIDLQFGSSEASYHIILELYDRGNIVLTDHEYTILNILRPRTDDSQDVKFAVREKYPKDLAKTECNKPTLEIVTEIFSNAKIGDPLKKLLIPHFVYGPAVLEHALIEIGLNPNSKIGTAINIPDDLPKIVQALSIAHNIFEESCKPHRGYITQNREKRVAKTDDQNNENLITYNEFHPFKFKQFEKVDIVEFDSFDRACDEFFSKTESQRLDLKALQQEKQAVKKLENVKKDHEKRVENLQKTQEADERKAELIQLNLDVVEKATTVIQSALANQIAWNEIENLIKDAQLHGDPIALSIKKLSLEKNSITLLLSEPGLTEDDYKENPNLKPQKVDIDLNLTAFANARKYYDERKHASLKERKTIEASSKAFRNAEKKTKKTLNEASKIATINKARKIYWFEKFLWFISSENYLVIGGRDSQQNELIVKRYMNPHDIYVHADLHGATTVVIKNHMGSELPVPPKTLNEAGTMAICNSAAWDAKIVTSAWWVNPNQVSKTAPSGEYLTTGSFMIRGKKNFLPPSYLIYGFGFLFKLDEDCIDSHKGERKIKTIEETFDAESELASNVSDNNENSSDNESDKESNDGDKTTENVKTNEYDKNENSEEKLTSDSDDGIFPATTITVDFTSSNRVAKVERLDSKPEFEKDQLIVDFGNGIAIDLAQQNSQSDKKSSARLTAKQRRELKKKKQISQNELDKNDQIDKEDNEDKLSTDETFKQTGQQQLKRGQKGKLKKIRDKYADQDDDDRERVMKLVGSISVEDKVLKGKKAKEAKRKQQIEEKRERQKQAREKQQQRLDASKAALTIQDHKNEQSQNTNVAIEIEDGHESSEDEDQDNAQLENLKILNSLTGQPVTDDVLLFAVPVCAPYSALSNYKFKVKVTPGSNKKGKASKMVINAFINDKTLTSQREKDLFKSLKDVDLARNLPGKVRITSTKVIKLQKGKKKL